MAEPTAYDLEQDQRLDSLESLISAEYEPPAGVEYSYPVANQGITQEQFRTMMRAAGSGTFVQHDDTGAQVSYRLVGHGTDTETNQRNTLILKPATTTGRAETVYHGFFHVLTEAMELPFPAVTTATTYHVCVTYDPRLFKTTPLKLEVYPGTPPTTNGRDSIVLFKVHREPNQLLSQATISQVNPWLGHVINVWRYADLPEPTSVEYGTLAVVINPSAGDHPELFTNRGVHGWVKISGPEKFSITYLQNNWEHYPEFGNLKGTIIDGFVHLQGMVRNGAWIEGRNIATVPSRAAPSKDCLLDVRTREHGSLPDIRIRPDGDIYINSRGGITTPSWLAFDGVIYPLDE